MIDNYSSDYSKCLTDPACSQSMSTDNCQSQFHYKESTLIDADTGAKEEIEITHNCRTEQVEVKHNDFSRKIPMALFKEFCKQCK